MTLLFVRPNSGMLARIAKGLFIRKCFGDEGGVDESQRHRIFARANAPTSRNCTAFCVRLASPSFAPQARAPGYYSLVFEDPAELGRNSTTFRGRDFWREHLLRRR
jgi:hypothetical protein